MHMLLERAASFFQAQGWRVKVNPCIIGDSGAIHSPDLHLSRDGEKDRVVFVFEELDGHGPLEARAHNAKDMGCAPLFVVGRAGAEAATWAERHRLDLLSREDLGEPVVEAPPPPLLAKAPAAVDAERSLPFDDGGAELLHAAPRAAPAKPAPRERPLTHFTPLDGVPEDGGAMLLPSEPREAPAPPAAMVPAQPPEAPAEDTGAELLASAAVAGPSAERILLHDPTIWDPRQRLAQVRQAAKAKSFETTAVPQGPASAWLRGLRGE